MSGNCGSANSPSKGSSDFKKVTVNFYQRDCTNHVYCAPVDYSMVQSQRRAEERQGSTPVWQSPPPAPSQPPAVVRRSIGVANRPPVPFPNWGMSRPSPGSPFPAGPSATRAAADPNRALLASQLRNIPEGQEDDKSSSDSESTSTPPSGLNSAFMTDPSAGGPTLRTRLMGASDTFRESM